MVASNSEREVTIKIRAQNEIKGAFDSARKDVRGFLEQTQRDMAAANSQQFRGGGFFADQERAAMDRERKRAAAEQAQLAREQEMAERRAAVEKANAQRVAEIRADTEVMALRAKGRHLDAELKQLEIHYSRKIAMATNAAEKEALAQQHALARAGVVQRGDPLKSVGQSLEALSKVARLVATVEIAAQGAVAATDLIGGVGKAMAGDWEAAHEQLTKFKQEAASIPMGVGAAFRVGNVIGEWLFGDEAEAKETTRRMMEMERFLARVKDTEAAFRKGMGSQQSMQEKIADELRLGSLTGPEREREAADIAKRDRVAAAKAEAEATKKEIIAQQNEIIKSVRDQLNTTMRELTPEEAADIARQEREAKVGNKQFQTTDDLVRATQEVMARRKAERDALIEQERTATRTLTDRPAQIDAELEKTIGGVEQLRQQRLAEIAKGEQAQRDKAKAATRDYWSAVLNQAKEFGTEIADQAKANWARIADNNAEIRAKELEAQGKHFDAERERTREEYRKRIEDAKTAREREQQERLRALAFDDIARREQAKAEDDYFNFYKSEIAKEREAKAGQVKADRQSRGAASAQLSASRFLTGVAESSSPQTLASIDKKTEEGNKIAREGNEALRELVRQLSGSKPVLIGAGR